MLELLVFVLFAGAISDAELSSSNSAVVPLPQTSSKKVEEFDQGLIRKKRWDYTTFQVLEELKKPHKIAKLRSSYDDNTGSIRYSITGQGAGSIFQINEKTGDLTVQHALDREMQSLYNLNVSAKNPEGVEVENATAITIQVLDKNDNRPVFPEAQLQALVKERSPIGTVVTKVTAHDKDDPEGPYGEIMYSLLPSNGSSKFMVHPHNGEIKTTSTNIDRESADVYELIIKARDDPTSELSHSATMTLIVRVSDVNDNPPIFINRPYTPTIPEDLGVGKEIMRIETRDADLGDNTLSSYSILSGIDSSKFQMVTEGNVGVLKVRKPLDYETTRDHKYRFKIKAGNVFSDPSLYLSPMEDVAEVTVHVIDVNEPPMFDKPEYIVSVREDAIPGDPIAFLSATDPEGDSFFYSLVGESDKFSISRSDGTISVKGKLDRETRDYYLLTAAAGVPGIVTEVSVRINILDVNDNPPRPAEGDKLELILCENSDSEIQKLQPDIKMTDMDDPKLNGPPFYFFPVDDRVYKHFSLVDNKDNTASLVTKHNDFSSSERKEYKVPIMVADSGHPTMNGPHQITVLVCQCSDDGSPLCDAIPQAAGIRLEVLLVLLSLFCVLLVLVVVLVAVRRRKRKVDALIKGSLSTCEEDVCENIISYNEEGGGEEDTDAFDLEALQRDYCSSNSGSQVKSRLDFSSPPSTKVSFVPPYEQPNFYRRANIASQDIRDYINGRKNGEDHDDRNLAFDSFRMYAYEGEGSDAGTLSSLCTSSADNDQDYDYLREWGPRFNRLADMYGSGRGCVEDDDSLSDHSLQNNNVPRRPRRVNPC